MWIKITVWLMITLPKEHDHPNIAHKCVSWCLHTQHTNVCWNIGSLSSLCHRSKSMEASHPSSALCARAFVLNGIYSVDTCFECTLLRVSVCMFSATQIQKRRRCFVRCRSCRPSWPPCECLWWTPQITEQLLLSRTRWTPSNGSMMVTDQSLLPRTRWGNTWQ